MIIRSNQAWVGSWEGQRSAYDIDRTLSHWNGEGPAAAGAGQRTNAATTAVHMPAVRRMHVMMVCGDESDSCEEHTE